jgi:hypothetical protein
VLLRAHEEGLEESLHEAGWFPGTRVRHLAQRLARRRLLDRNRDRASILVERIDGICQELSGTRPGDLTRSPGRCNVPARLDGGAVDDQAVREWAPGGSVTSGGDGLSNFSRLFATRSGVPRSHQVRLGIGETASDAGDDSRIARQKSAVGAN